MRAAAASYFRAITGSRNVRSRASWPAGGSASASRQSPSAAAELADARPPRPSAPRAARRGSAPAATSASAASAASHLELVHEPPRRRRPHPLEELQDTEPAHLVEGVLEDPEARERVLHVGRLHELQAAVLHERDVPPGELDLEVVRVMGRAEQDRLRLQRDAFLAMREDRPADGVALLGFVEARPERSAAPRPVARGSERLLVPLRAERDHRVRRRQDRRRRSVVPFELDRSSRPGSVRGTRGCSSRSRRGTRRSPARRRRRP